MSGAYVFHWGRQRDGQCGNKEQNELSWPRKLDTNILFKTVRAAGTRTIGISSEGELYAWGTGHMGELGLAYQDAVFTPTKIEKVPEDVHWKQLACGYQYTIAVTDEGDVYSWGSNEFGQLGLGHTKMIDRPTKIPTLSKITKICAAHNHVIALNTFGEIFTWGSNHCGQLGRINVENFAVPGQVLIETATFRSVDCNDTACAAISNKGEIYVWGSGGNGKLGLGNTRSHPEPELVKEVKDIPFFQVSLGTHHTLALTETRQIYAWGAGHHGELGTGNRRRQLRPVALNSREKWATVLAGDEISFGITLTGALYVWGNCAGGLLGNGRKVGNLLVPTKLNSSIEFRHISTSRRHIVVLGIGQEQPPSENWKEDELVDPDVNKKYDETDPERYLYGLYFAPRVQIKDKRKKSTKEEITTDPQEPQSADEEEVAE